MTLFHLQTSKPKTTMVLPNVILKPSQKRLGFNWLQKYSKVICYFKELTLCLNSEHEKYNTKK